eukprot:8790424-Karenia_brevis.AAC.1
MKVFSVRPRQDCSSWSRHVFRELNGEADALAGLHAYTYVEHIPDLAFKCYRLFFDGSVSQKNSGGGWVLYGSSS